MYILDKIKSFIKNFGKKALPEPEEFYSESNSNTQQKYNPSTVTQQKTSYSRIDRDILAFLQNYYKKLALDPNTTAYSALYSLNGKPVNENEYIQNQYEEKNLIDWINTTKKYEIVSSQQDSKGNPSFYHISTSPYIQIDSEKSIRFYINCENKNISALAKVLLEENTNPNFYLKFVSNIQNYSENRGEKIVIYSDVSEINYIIQLLKNTKSIHPELFTDSENTLPFLKSVENIASISPEVPEKYVDLYGRKKEMTQSTNSFISQILIDSYIRSLP